VHIKTFTQSDAEKQVYQAIEEKRGRERRELKIKLFWLQLITFFIFLCSHANIVGFVFLICIIVILIEVNSTIVVCHSNLFLSFYSQSLM